MIFYFNTSFTAVKGGDTKIATWNFDVENVSTRKVFTLSDTITKKECDIEDGMIGPGTEGAFKIVIKKQNVKFNYELKLILENTAPSNLRFYIKQSNEKKEYKNLKDLFDDNNLSGSIGIDQKDVEYEIFWKWPYETYNTDGSVNIENDRMDYEYSKTNSTYSFEIEITGKQSRK